MKKLRKSRCITWGFGGFCVLFLVFGAVRMLRLPPEKPEPKRDLIAELAQAAQTNDYIRAGFLLGQGAPANARNAAQTPILVIAAEAGAGDVAKLLLDHGADVEAADALERTPLLAAASAKQRNTVRFLIARGASPNRGNNEAKTALLAACAAGDCGVLEELLNSGAQLWPGCANGRGPVITALKNKHFEAALLLLERGADPNECDENGSSVLMWANRLRAKELVNALLNNRAVDTEHRNRVGENARDWADKEVEI